MSSVYVLYVAHVGPLCTYVMHNGEQRSLVRVSCITNQLKKSATAVAESEFDLAVIQRAQEAHVAITCYKEQAKRCRASLQDGKSMYIGIENVLTL